MAKDSAFILLRLRRNSPVLAVRETTLKDEVFSLRPFRSYKIKRGLIRIYYSFLVYFDHSFAPSHEPRKRQTMPAAKRTAMIPVRKMPSKTPAPPMDSTTG